MTENKSQDNIILNEKDIKHFTRYTYCGNLESEEREVKKNLTLKEGITITVRENKYVLDNYQKIIAFCFQSILECNFEKLILKECIFENKTPHITVYIDFKFIISELYKRDNRIACKINNSPYLHLNEIYFYRCEITNLNFDECSFSYAFFQNCNFHKNFFSRFTHVKNTFRFQYCTFDNFHILNSSAHTLSIDEFKCKNNIKIQGSKINDSFHFQNIKESSSEIEIENNIIGDFYSFELHNTNVIKIIKNQIKRSKLNDFIGNQFFYDNNTITEKIELINFLFNEISFSDINLNCSLLLKEIKYKLSFGDINILPNGELKIINCTLSSLDISNSTNNGLIFLNRNTIDNLQIQETVNINSLNDVCNNIKILNNIETARILKDAAFKNNNVIDALSYKVHEMELLKQEKSTSKWTKFLLNINYLSNKHGLKWEWALGWILLFALGFLLLINCIGLNKPLFVFCNGEFSFLHLAEVIASYFSMINILSFGNGFEDYELNGYGKILYFLSQIIMAYLIYQFVSAFRKYGKD